MNNLIYSSVHPLLLHFEFDRRTKQQYWDREHGDNNTGDLNRFLSDKSAFLKSEFNVTLF